MQFWPPDDEHMVPKHVEARNTLIVKQKFCASSWLITDINIIIRLLIHQFVYLISCCSHANQIMPILPAPHTRFSRPSTGS